MTGVEGFIYSPNYPKNYNKNETCEWFIDVDEGHSVELKFEDVDLFQSTNCLQNYVKVSNNFVLVVKAISKASIRYMMDVKIDSRQIVKG